MNPSRSVRKETAITVFLRGMERHGRIHTALSLDWTPGATFSLSVVNLFGKSLSQQFECILIRRDLKSESLRSEHRQDVVLVVGHANSVPALLKGLGYPAEINSGNGVRQPVRADSGE